MMGNVRPASGHVHQSDPHSDVPHSHGDSPDLSSIAHHNSAKSRQFTKSSVINPADGQTATVAKDNSGSLTGSGLRSFGRGAENRSGRRRGHVDSHHHHHRNGDERNGHHGAQLATSATDSHVQNNTKTEAAIKSRIVTTNINVAAKKGDKITPIISKNSGAAVHSMTKSADASSGSSNTGTAISSAAASPVAASKPVATLTTNATAKVDAASANSTSNTTSTKFIKTKTIKVTTVVKGGTAADVAAVAASQAEIANAVSQGKDINSTSIAQIAKAAAEKNLKATKPPPGSITVKRENGVSVITLADGIGEPVVIRATGPVKIERIIRPDGKVQFIINPVETSTQPRTTKPASGERAEVEPEDLPTTTITSSSTMFEFTPTSDYPFIVDSPGPLHDINNIDGNINNLLPLDLISAFTTTTVKPMKPPAKSAGRGKETRKNGVKNKKVNKPLQMFPVFETPKIPRPPPTIPRPPKVPDTMFGNQGLLDSFAAPLFSGSNELLMMQGASSSTANPLLTGKGKKAPPSDIHSFTSATDVMPQYDVIQKSSNDLIVR